MALVVAFGVSTAACTTSDPAPDRFLVGATLDDGEVLLRVGSCLAGEMEALDFSIDRGKGSEPESNLLWRLDAQRDGGPHLKSGESLDVVVGTPPEGFLEATPLRGPLPTDETIQVDVTMSNQGFGFFFRPHELRAGRMELEDTQVDADEFDDRLKALCS